MPSIKQVEAFYWSGQLGSFVAAAERLNTTQSNISKRIQELESSVGAELFDRSKRAIILTAKGKEIMELGESLLRVHMTLRHAGLGKKAISGPFYFGVTEAVALTWLARFSQQMQTTFEGVIPISIIDTTVNLSQLLLARKIDLAIGAARRMDSSLLFKPLASVKRVWVASPSLIPHNRRLTPDDLAELPMLGHGPNSAQHHIVGHYLRNRGISPRIVTSCTSTSALARMAIDGVGITYVQYDVFEPEISAGRLKIIPTEFEIPPLQYVAAYRDDVTSPVASLMAEEAAKACNFKA
jgi:DNA-binding transcriptional LysR family regulator